MHIVSAVRLRRWAIRGLSKAHLAVYRMTRGRVLGPVAGMPVHLLTTTGRRSGKAHTTPLTFFRDATDLVVIASNGGADRPPAWSLNLQQTPRAVARVANAYHLSLARKCARETGYPPPSPRSWRWGPGLGPWSRAARLTRARARPRGNTPGPEQELFVI
jgi:deazaflavin-dependent oxidoreductase (nitroreductase family)